MGPGSGWPAHGAAYSADSRRLATTGMDGIVTPLDPASGRPVLALRDLPSDGQCVRFSPDGNRLAAACQDGTIRIWDGTDLRRDDDQSLLTLGYQGGIWALGLNTRSNWIAFGGDRFSDPKLKHSPVLIYETGTERLVHRLPGLSVVVMCLAFDPTGTFLAASGDGPSRSDNATPTVWDLATGAEAFKFEPFEGNGILFAIAYSRDGKRSARRGLAPRCVDAFTGARAQVSNLPYRRLAVGKALKTPVAMGGLATRSPADWKSALLNPVTGIAWETQRRLHHRYRHLLGPGRKKAPVVIAALARELSGFFWAIARQVRPRAPRG